MPTLKEAYRWRATRSGSCGEEVEVGNKAEWVPFTDAHDGERWTVEFWWATRDTENPTFVRQVLNHALLERGGSLTPSLLDANRDKVLPVSDEWPDLSAKWAGMLECGHLIGHLAVPNKDGVLTYLPIRCNQNEGHERPWSPHGYHDPRSGMWVNKTLHPATTTVDERGCVVEA